MKKMLFTLVTMLTIAVSANAMSYEQARNEALFLTDKMAYELNLSDAQYEAAYEINLDYLMGVTSYNDVFGPYWERRNLDLSYILYSWQWDLFRAATYFYRPLYWESGYWHFGIYARYPHRDYFYFGRPHFFSTYRGGHSWRMNGGRSFYEGRRDSFRPNIHRDQHFGMRNGWDRGDFGGRHDHSSTRITVDNRRDGNWRGQNNDSYRNHNNSFDNNRRDNDNYRNRDNNSFENNRNRDNNSFERNSHNNSNGSFQNNNGSFQNNNGSFQNNNGSFRSNDNSFQRSNRSNDNSFQRSSNSSFERSTRSSGSFQNNNGSFGGARNNSSFGGTRSNGSFNSNHSSGSSMGSSHHGGSGSGSSHSHGSFGGGRHR